MNENCVNCKQNQGLWSCIFPCGLTACINHDFDTTIIINTELIKPMTNREWLNTLSLPNFLNSLKCPSKECCRCGENNININCVEILKWLKLEHKEEIK